MAVINAVGKYSQTPYPVEIAGDTPTPEEQGRIDAYVGQQEAPYAQIYQEYFGSSDALTEDVQKLGKDNFTREILFYCRSKAELSYVEAREQFARKVLESNDYYNGHIRVRVHGKGILKS